jgi:hypothetical protein
MSVWDSLSIGMDPMGLMPVNASSTNQTGV